MKSTRLWKLFLMLSLSFLCIQCASQKESLSPEKKVQYEEIEKLVNQKQFSIVADWANPLNMSQVNFYGNRYDLSNLLPPGSGGSRINLIGNPNSLSVNKDSVTGYLPYYGEVQVVRDYGGRGGIAFKGVPENYKVEKKPAEGKIKISFDMDDESESFKVLLTLFGDNQAQINLNSAYRHSISYDGKVMALKNAESNKTDK